MEGTELGTKHTGEQKRWDACIYGTSGPVGKKLIK